MSQAVSPPRPVRFKTGRHRKRKRRSWQRHAGPLRPSSPRLRGKSLPFQWPVLLHHQPPRPLKPRFGLARARSTACSCRGPRNRSCPPSLHTTCPRASFRWVQHRAPLPPSAHPALIRRRRMAHRSWPSAPPSRPPRRYFFIAVLTSSSFPHFFFPPLFFFFFFFFTSTRLPSSAQSNLVLQSRPRRFSNPTAPTF